MSLCAVCQSIEHELFSPVHDNARIGQGPEVMHLPINSIKVNARAGCPVCTCLIAGSDTDWMAGSPRLRDVPVVLRRVTIDSQQALAICIGMDDVSHTYFFRVPASWGIRISSIVLDMSETT